MIPITTSSILHPLYTNKREKPTEVILLLLAGRRRREGYRNHGLLQDYFKDKTGGKTPATTLLLEHKKNFGETRSFMPNNGSFCRQDKTF